MNDPWLPIVSALSGQRQLTPTAWPAKRVHRILGESLAAVVVRRPPATPAARLQQARSWLA